MILIMDILPVENHAAHALLDAVLLSVFVFPVLVLTLRRPLQNAFSEVATLRGILPICSYCKKIRDEKDGWHQMEAYIRERSEAEFSHGMCPNCEKDMMLELDAMNSK